jgi:hypothetical protein
MAQCDMGYEHDDPAAAAEPVVIPVDTGTNENDVEIARVEAAASVKREQEWTKQEALRLESEIGELRGQVDGMRDVLATLVPPPPEESDEPVVIPVEPPAAPAEPVAPPPETAVKPEASKKAKKGFFG